MKKVFVYEMDGCMFSSLKIVSGALVNRFSQVYQAFINGGSFFVYQIKFKSAWLSRTERSFTLKAF